MHYPLRFVLVASLLALCRGLFAQQEAALIQTNYLLDRNKNDSALMCLSPLLSRLEQSAQKGSPLGLKVRLAQARAMEQKCQHTEALTLFQELKDECEKAGHWETLTETYLAMSRLYQKIYRDKETKESLEQADLLMKRHGLTAYYPALYKGLAIWHLYFGFPDSIGYYYNLMQSHDQTAHDPTTQYQLLMIKAVMIKENLPASIAVLKEALEIIRPLGDHTRLSDCYHQISQNYCSLSRYKESLIFNDSSISSCYQAMQEGNSNLNILAQAYKKRSDIYAKTRQLDSVQLYASRGNAQERYFLRQQESERVAEVSARYKSEKKSLQIKQLDQRLHIMFAIALLTLFFGAILTYLYVQLRQAKIRAEQIAEQLRSLDAAKSRFFANISHELRTPLTLLTSPIKTLLEESQLTEKQTLLLRMAERSGQQLGQLINSILDLRKLEMGKMAVDAEPTELRPYFQIYFAQFESLAQHNEVEYVVKIEIPEGNVSLLDREKYRQILFNLLSNAFKFTPAHGHISATVQVTGKTLHLSVADNGPGIHPDDIPQIFERYFQTSRAERSAEGGTGIGLALCREYVHLFGGDIQVESTLGKGATFRVSLPITLCHHPPLAIQNVWSPATTKSSLRIPLNTRSSGNGHARSGGMHRRPTILLVEDNIDLQDYISFVLSEKYQVIAVPNGQAALDLLHSSPSLSGMAGPALVLSDLMMPVMDGYQLLERFRSEDSTRHIPFIMLTARAETRDRLKALRIGVDDYLTKPFDQEELLVRIDNLLKNQSARNTVVATDDNNSFHDTASAPLMSQPDREWLEAIEDYVRISCSSDTLNVASLANEFSMSESTLLRQIKRLTGLSPLQYIREVRLDEARKLLENRACVSIAQVASKVGYTDSWSFARSFKQRFGVSPSELMKP